MSSTATFSASVFVDASYDGDLLILSGVNYTYGRESIQQYNESLAGVRAFSSFANYIYPILATVDAISSDLISFVDPSPLAEVGSADSRLMGFSYRFLFIISNFIIIS